MRRFNIIVTLALTLFLGQFSNSVAYAQANSKGSSKYDGLKRVNSRLSPDGKYTAFTSTDNNIYILNKDTQEVIRLTNDGSELILNGYASWVYYEEIFGRSSNYKAFWWSPDSKKIAFYQFDNTAVPSFPIYSAEGQNGFLSQTRYPKAGQRNPTVKIGIIEIENPTKIIWADFEEYSEQYFGTPFWGDDSKQLFVQWMPRVQQELRLYAVNARSGRKTTIYKENYHTWVNWMNDMLFTDKGLYMARDFETGWQQIYFLSYNGKEFKRLTDGPNWRVKLIKCNEKKKEVYFTAYRDSDLHACLYKVNKKGEIILLSDATKHASNVEISEDFKSCTMTLSCLNMSPYSENYTLNKAHIKKMAETRIWLRQKERPALTTTFLSEHLYTEFVYLTLEDGLKVPAAFNFPKGFDPAKKYPVVMEIYGGPNTAYVRDIYTPITERESWYYENGYIRVVADTRAAGHNGRKGVDLIYKDLVSVPVQDCLSWAKYLVSLPYVDATRIGVEGFSFGGTMTAILVMTHPEYFKCGIAGGGVYDWQLYDTHYTERFMDTPQRNVEGYEKSKVLNYVDQYDHNRTFLKITHGTGDDNVHFQNTLQLINALQLAGKQFELMIYPDGMHGYNGAQGKHDFEADTIFWEKHLKK